MAKIIIMQGLPGSGKSTYAKEYVLNNPMTVRVNRDDLREMMFGSLPWHGKREGQVVGAEKHMVREALAGGYSVIVDDTNLRPKTLKMWEDFYCLNVSGHEVVNMHKPPFNVPVELCVQRDKQRVGKAQVGKAVIHRMALEAGLIPWWEGSPKRPARCKGVVICDLDGTLADLSHRLKYIEQTPKDYKSFLGTVMMDEPIEGTIKWLDALWETHEIVILSGRGLEAGKDTEMWLRIHGVNYDWLFMRQSGDYRDDRVIKKELLDLIVKQLPNGKDDIAFCIDDRPRVVQLWKDEGLKVYPVHQDRWEGKEDLVTV